MIPKLLRAPLPPGLRAVARRNQDGYLVITLNSALTPAQLRAAVAETRRVARRPGWLLPAVLGPAAAAAVRAAGKHPAALAVGWAVATGTAAAIAIAVMPAAPGLRPVQQDSPAPGHAPVVAVARPHVHRRRQDGGAVSVLPPARHVTRPASAPAPAALTSPAPPLPELPLPLPLPHIHAHIQVRVHVPQLPVPLPSPTVQVCVPLNLIQSGACVNVAA